MAERNSKRWMKHAELVEFLKRSSQLTTLEERFQWAWEGMILYHKFKDDIDHGDPPRLTDLLPLK